MPYDEGRALIEELNALAVHPDLTYEHHWRPHELIVWDNRCLMHRATGYDPRTQRRVVRRCTVLGEEPVGVDGKRRRRRRRRRRCFNFLHASCRHERRSPRRRFADNRAHAERPRQVPPLRRPAGGGDRLAARGDRPRPRALVRLARQRGLAVRPVRARRGADLPAAVDRDAADRARLPAPHRRHRPRQRRAVLALFIGQEFCYYWFHRAAHRVRWFWCNHAVHHSPNELNLSAAYRIGILGRASGSARRSTCR